MLLGLVVLLSFLSEAVVGFGGTILTVALGAHLYPLEVLLPAFIPVNLVLSLYIVIRHREAIDARVLCRRILPFMGVGLPVGLLVLEHVGGRALLVPFAVFVIGLSLVEMARLVRHGAAPARPLPALGGAAVLVAGGVIHGLYGSGGPMAVYYASREVTDKRRFRSTLSALWLVLNAVLVVGYAIKGDLGFSTLPMSAALLLPLVVGIVAGEAIHDRVRPGPFRIWLYALLLVAGGVLLGRGLG